MNSITPQLNRIVKIFISRHSVIGKILIFLYYRIPYLVKSRINAPKAQAIIDDFASNNDNVFIVQVGANDGSADPISNYIKEFKWKGLLIEPMTPTFVRLKSNYSGCDGLIFENCGITEQKENRSIFYVDEEVHLRSASFSRSYAEEHCDSNGLDRNTLREKIVPCDNLQSLLSKHSIEKVDFLVIDAEGLDADVIYQFDFNKFRPKLILYETSHMSFEDRKNIDHKFKELNYITLSFWGDDLAILKKNG